MTSPILERVSTPDGKGIVPGLVSAMLDLPADDMAALAHVHRDTMSRSPQDGRVQAGLATVLKVLVMAVELMDSGSQARAVNWFKKLPLSGFGGKTALDLVREGKDAAVMEHLAALGEGIYA